jgi:hypothetical protein
VTASYPDRLRAAAADMLDELGAAVTLGEVRRIGRTYRLVLVHADDELTLLSLPADFAEGLCDKPNDEARAGLTGRIRTALRSAPKG